MVERELVSGGGSGQLVGGACGGVGSVGVSCRV